MGLGLDWNGLLSEGQEVVALCCRSSRDDAPGCDPDYQNDVSVVHLVPGCTHAWMVQLRDYHPAWEEWGCKIALIGGRHVAWTVQPRVCSPYGCGQAIATQTETVTSNSYPYVLSWPAASKNPFFHGQVAAISICCCTRNRFCYKSAHVG